MAKSDAQRRPRVTDVLRVIEDVFPSHWAEPWDRVGLLCGDADAAVSGIHVCLDPSADALEQAISLGANVLVTHHPLLLQPEMPVSGCRSYDMVRAAITADVAIIAAHTNLDRAPEGASALAVTLGLPSGEPLECSYMPMVMVTVYVPAESALSLREAMTSAGAGSIGTYRGCSFSIDGIGRFVPTSGSSPHIGASGEESSVPEQRIEAVCAPAAVDGVVSAIRKSHPYEEPLVTLTDMRIPRGVARLGRVCEIPPITLTSLAEQVASRLDCSPRIWGEPSALVSKVATASGSAGSLIADTLALHADVLIAGEVRYHDALDAVARHLCVIETGHDVSEWPLVAVLADTIRKTPGLSRERVTVGRPERKWWTL